MTRETDSDLGERRRAAAAKIIAGHARARQMRDTNERPLDQDALRQASIGAGLEPAPPVSSDGEWFPARIIHPKPGTSVEFTERGAGGVRLGPFRDMEFVDRDSGAVYPLQEALLWRYRTLEEA